MIAIFVTIKVKPGYADQFRDAILENAQGAVKDEPGCLRFDILQNAEDPNTFHLYEVYADDSARESHWEMPHFKKWQATVKDWFDGNRQRVVTKPLFPSDKGWRKQKPHLINW
jgi:autoinducer 2-degrading protein